MLGRWGTVAAPGGLEANRERRKGTVGHNEKAEGQLPAADWGGPLRVTDMSSGLTRAVWIRQSIAVLRKVRRAPEGTIAWF